VFCVILGLLKFCTFGFMLIWTLIDILLIALQVNAYTTFCILLFRLNAVVSSIISGQYAHTYTQLFYGNYTGQRVLTSTYSYKLEYFTGANFYFPLTLADCN